MSIVRRLTVTADWVRGTGQATDHITISDSASRLGSHPRTPGDSVTISDQARASGIATHTADSITFADSA